MMWWLPRQVSQKSSCNMDPRERKCLAFIILLCMAWLIKKVLHAEHRWTGAHGRGAVQTCTITSK
eukprot:4505091-Amphidinium_carterae.1